MRKRTVASALLLPLVALGACAEEPPTEEEFPETATVEDVDLDEEMGERIEWDDESLLTDSDVGNPIVATGSVVGIGTGGFLLSTEGYRVIWVESDATVEMGQTVEVTGTLAQLEVAMLEEVESDVFGDEGFDVEWDVEDVYFIAGGTVDAMVAAVN